ncbi:uncharacterized protein F5891DRAFT_1132834 [Suillus fuscotomentosus]|uniref:Uncharacterized protein n=1 Tax=Suillus fuscotomentosus TaxID=1912939 RepID=A0AAD4HCW6_9AGAM|nr:uncharacterized protein F5891DRAFT_1132834 [Suillus fuscotomentosus]KAG1885364.1 hypothetical protein F5891DRAFT_1132834 [Suillus fuscotomentosus]
MQVLYFDKTTIFFTGNLVVSLEASRNLGPLFLDVGPQPDTSDNSSDTLPTKNQLFTPCTADGMFLPPGTPSTLPPPKSPLDWSPYCNDMEFATAEFVFKQSHMSNAATNQLFDLMAAQLLEHNGSPPFVNHKDLHRVIDATQLGNVPWQYYEVWYRDPRLMVHNMLATPTYKGEIDFQQAVCLSYVLTTSSLTCSQDEISKDPSTHGSMFVPIILSSDKTTVSMGTGNNEYYPLYASIGNVHNNVWCAHHNALIVISFLSVPKTVREHAKTELSHIFHHQLFHHSLSAILTSLKPAMTEYEVLCCADGPFIADYEEQLVLSYTMKNWCTNSGLYRSQEHTDLLIHENMDSDTMWHEYGIMSVLVPFTDDFPQANIHQLLSFDLLHQLIKGAFKDHLVDWVVEYLRLTHGTKQGDEIMSDIDHRIAAVAPFTGLRQFPDGHGFKQWTGNDSKALMKVFIPVIKGHIPQDMVHAFRALLEFCYIALHNIITEAYLNQLQDVLTCSLSYPRQHSMTHYADMIRLFGALNGLCSSITESKHIKVVKDPWRWSNRNNALASRVDFTVQGMLVDEPDVPVIAQQLEENIDNGDVVDDPDVLALTRGQTVAALAEEVDVPSLQCLIHYFLFSQLFPGDPHNPEDVPTASCPRHDGSLYVFSSAAATFYAPSDPSGMGSMQCKQIHVCPLWRNIYPHNDCVFVNTNPNLEGMKGLEVARVKCFFSFRFNWVMYPCALVHWFDKVDDCPDKDTGMWIVHPSVHDNGTPNLTVIHIETVYHAAHLIPVYSPNFIPSDMKYFHSYDIFRSFYVNKYADHHAFEIVL